MMAAKICQEVLTLRITFELRRENSVPPFSAGN
jgi:hypothetical protein